MILPLLALLQSAPPPVQIDSMPRVTLNEALQRAARLDPDYVQALGCRCNAEWSRTAARLAFVLPSLTGRARRHQVLDRVLQHRNRQPAVLRGHVPGRGRYELFRVRKFTDLARTSAELEAATATELQRRYAAALLIESDYYSVLAETRSSRGWRGSACGARVSSSRSHAHGCRRARRCRPTRSSSCSSLPGRVSYSGFRDIADGRAAATGPARRRRRPGGCGAARHAPRAGPPHHSARGGRPALDQGPEYRVARANERAANRRSRASEASTSRWSFSRATTRASMITISRAGAMSGPSRWAQPADLGRRPPRDHDHTGADQSRRGPRQSEKRSRARRSAGRDGRI